MGSLDRKTLTLTLSHGEREKTGLPRAAVLVVWRGCWEAASLSAAFFLGGEGE